MSDTLVFQSHRDPWLIGCLDSVRGWAAAQGYDLDDQLFDGVPADLLARTAQQPVIAADLARLHVLRQALEEGHDTVVWLDADFLIFDGANFVLPEEPYAVGREVWVQHDRHGKLKAYKQVHNALLMFRRGNALLDFYLETAERLLRRHRGGMPPQFIGPKLLTALHNICQLPVMETAGMLSPLVIRDLLQGGGEALQRFVARSPRPIAGANLCLSSRDSGALSDDDMAQLIARLQHAGIALRAAGAS